MLWLLHKAVAPRLSHWNPPYGRKSETFTACEARIPTHTYERGGAGAPRTQRPRLALVLVGLLPVMCCMRNGACNSGKIYSKAVTLLYDMPSKCHSDLAVGEICAGNLEIGRV